MGVLLVGVFLVEVFLVGVFLVGVFLMGVLLMGVFLVGVIVGLHDLIGGSKLGDECFIFLRLSRVVKYRRRGDAHLERGVAVAEEVREHVLRLIRTRFPDGNVPDGIVGRGNVLLGGGGGRGEGIRLALPGAGHVFVVGARFFVGIDRGALTSTHLVEISQHRLFGVVLVPPSDCLGGEAVSDCLGVLGMPGEIRAGVPELDAGDRRGVGGA